MHSTEKARDTTLYYGKYNVCGHGGHPVVRCIVCSPFSWVSCILSNP